MSAVSISARVLPHTLAITEHYTILMDLPLFWDPELLKHGAHKVKFHRELPSRFGIIPRHGSGDSIRALAHVLRITATEKAQFDPQPAGSKRFAPSQRVEDVGVRVCFSPHTGKATC